MSHWAELDENNVVLRVLVGNNNESDEGKTTMESLGGTWVQTSYNANFRAHYAGIGYWYLPKEDIFMPPKCHAEAILDESNAQWLCENEEHNVVPTR